MTDPPTKRSFGPLYLAGFTTAFGAHGVAVVLGATSGDIGLTLFSLGLVLALYDVAEVILKPVFGVLSDRIGAKPVIIGGLIAFAAASAVALVSPAPVVLGLARLGQGAAASAFSPASSAVVARLAGRERLGRYFGRYGAWKSLGYVAGPLLGIALARLWGIQVLYLALGLLAAAAAIWVAVAVPMLPVAPRPRYTLADLYRQTTEPGFLIPTLLLATTTAILGVAVGFLPLFATRLDLGPLAGAVAVAVIALVSTLLQPQVGRLRDRGRISAHAGGFAGLTVAGAALVALAVTPHAVTLFAAATAIGVMTGTVTPLAFAHLASNTPDERIGRTMGSAELGREIGDAGGPLLIGAIATAGTLSIAFGVLAAISFTSGAIGWATLRTQSARTASVTHSNSE